MLKNGCVFWTARRDVAAVVVDVDDDDNDNDDNDDDDDDDDDDDADDDDDDEHVPGVVDVSFYRLGECFGRMPHTAAAASAELNTDHG